MPAITTLPTRSEVPLEQTWVLESIFATPTDWEPACRALIAPERMEAFTSAIPAFCAECARRSECQGGCKAAAQVCYGSLTEEEPFLHYIRNAVEKNFLEPLTRDIISSPY